MDDAGGGRAAVVRNAVANPTANDLVPLLFALELLASLPPSEHAWDIHSAMAALPLPLSQPLT